MNLKHEDAPQLDRHTLKLQVSTSSFQHEAGVIDQVSLFIVLLTLLHSVISNVLTIRRRLKLQRGVVTFNVDTTGWRQVCVHGVRGAGGHTQGVQGGQ